MERAVLSPQVFRFGLFEANTLDGTLSRNGVRVKIQDQPFRALILLLQRSGETVTREELRKNLWPEGTYVDFDGSLNVILKKLRSAIDDVSANPRFIETIPRRGYRFIAPVSHINLQADVPPAPSLPAAVHSDEQIYAAPAKIGSRKLIFLYAYGALILVAAITIGALWKHRSHPTASSKLPTVSSVPMRRSVAVLGFHNVSGRPSDAWMATAFAEMLSTELAAGDKLRLVSGEEVSNLRLSSPWSLTDSLNRSTTSRIGGALSSDLLVLGAYATTGSSEHGRLRIDVRMQDSNTGEILTEIAEDGSAADAFGVISRIGERLRVRLGVPSPEPSDQARVLATLPRDTIAARFYAEGLAKLRDFDALVAKDLLEQAVKADPNFSLAHLMLARAWDQLGYQQKRKEESKQALALSAGLGTVDRMLVEGNYYESLAQHEKAASIYRALFQLFPDNVEYGLLLAHSQIADAHASQAANTIAQLRALPSSVSNDPRIDLVDVDATAQNDAERTVLIQTAMAKASAQGEKLVYGQALKRECMNRVYGDHPELGLPACEDAYKIFLAAGNRLAAADAMRLIADYEGGRSHLDQAIATYERALKTLEGLGDHLKTGAILNNMAIAYVNGGHLDRGEQLYRQAKYHFEQAGDKALVATTDANIADILYLRGDLPGAEKMYRQSLQIESSLDQNRPGYVFYRLADLELARGRLADADRDAQAGIEDYQKDKSVNGYLASARMVFGDVLRAEDNSAKARQQYQESLAIAQQLKSGELIGESQVELADLALDEGHPDQAQPQLQAAIAEFEKEGLDPDSISAYTVLSHMLELEGKFDDSRKAVQHAAELGAKDPDPALRIPLAIQTARLEMSSHSGTASAARSAQRELQTALGIARKFGYYNLECEARIALGELQARIAPEAGQKQLQALASDARSRGFAFVARRAEQVISPGSALASNQPSR